MLDMQQGLVYYPHTCGTRYHLKEFRGTREPQNLKELFNHRHSSLRTTVERAFGTLKNRFKIFKSQQFFPLKTQVKIVMACCALHSWILQDGPDEYVYDDDAWYRTLPRSIRNRTDMHEENVAWARKRDDMAQRMWEDKVGATLEQVQEIMIYYLCKLLLVDLLLCLGHI